MDDYKYNKYKSKYFKHKYYQLGGSFCTINISTKIINKHSKLTSTNFKSEFDLYRHALLNLNLNTDSIRRSKLIPEKIQVNDRMFTLDTKFPTDFDPVCSYCNKDENGITKFVVKFNSFLTKSAFNNDLNAIIYIKKTTYSEYFIKVFEANTFYILMDQADGTLADMKGKLSPGQLVSLFKCLVKVLMLLANDKYYYTDLKPENIFFNQLDESKMQIVFGDFGGMVALKSSPQFSNRPYKFIDDPGYYYNADSMEQVVIYGLATLYLSMLTPESTSRQLGEESTLKNFLSKRSDHFTAYLFNKFFKDGKFHSLKDISEYLNNITISATDQNEPIIVILSGCGKDIKKPASMIVSPTQTENIKIQETVPVLTQNVNIPTIVQPTKTENIPSPSSVQILINENNKLAENNNNILSTISKLIDELRDNNEIIKKNNLSIAL